MFKGLSATNKKAVIATLIISLVLLFGSMTAPLLGYIMMSYPDENVFLILQVPAFVGMIVSFLMGPLAMKVNLKYLMAIAALTAFIYFMIFALVGSGNFMALVIGAGVVGICQGAGMVLTSSIFGQYVADPDQRANFVAISGALLNGGGAVVNVVGGIIAAANGGINWNNAYWLGLLVIPCLVVFWIMMPKAPVYDDVPAGGPGGHGGPGGPPMIGAQGGIPLKVWLIIAMGLIGSMGMAAFLLNVGTYITVELAPYGYTSVESGMANSLWTILGVVAGFSFPFIVRVLKAWIVPIAYVGGAIGFFFIMTFQSNIALIYVGAGMAGLFLNIAMPYVMGRMMALTPIKYIPIVMSLNMGAMNLCFTFAPTVLAIAAAPMGGLFSQQIFIGVILLGAVAVISFFLFVLWKDKEPAGPPPAAE